MQNDPNERIILKDGDKTRVTRRKNVRFELLLRELTNITKLIVDNDNRKVFHKIAWALGEAGEVEACEAIMKAAKEPVYTPSQYMYGWYGGIP